LAGVAEFCWIDEVLLRRFIAAAAACALSLASPARAETPAHRPTAHGPNVVDGTRLTVEPRLQRVAERLLEGARPAEGAIVVSDVQSGRILAWASYGDGADWVSSAHAPSASLFKLVTATALLEGGHVDPATPQCWSGGEHAISLDDLRVDSHAECAPFGDALGRSINAVFARLSTKYLSSADLLSQASKLGFLGRVPIDVPTEENTVTVHDGELGMARAAAGFWNGETSPLGPLFAMTTIANDGERVRLHVVDRGDADVRVSLGRAMKVDTARTLRKMLQITTQRGTCAKVFHNPDGSSAFPNMPIAAKTGTLIGGHPTRMFSWFAAFAPATDPKIAVSVMLGNNVAWLRKGNQVGRDLLEAYFDSPPPVANAATPIHRRR
jgi:peptidoglycan glycosyltransferase